MESEILHGDCLEVLKKFPENHFDSVVCDPPYFIGFMGKDFDRSENNIARSPEIWREVLRISKPGAHLLAFGATRTYHRLTCAIEDAGWEIRDSLHWIYGSGFPKSLDVSKAIDKAAGAEREVISEGKPVKRMIPGADQDRTGSWIKDNGREFIPVVTAAATADAARWDGWGTALKPAHEPIVVARKPLAGTVAANVLEWGTGGLNIDGCRVGSETMRESRMSQSAGGVLNMNGRDVEHGNWQQRPNDNPAEHEGRWPPNILLSDEAAMEMDAQSGTLKSGSNNFIRRSSADQEGNTSPAYGAESRSAGTEMVSYGDQGGASRFFPCFKYQAKASPRERPKVDGIAHPTCKPVDLMRWLVRLVTPPGGIVLDPFAGTGTTGEACILEGFRYILIEREADYIKLINERLRKHLEQPTLFL